jgi:hypothetical protein
MKNKYAILLLLLIFMTASAATAVTELSGLHLKRLNGETVLKIDLTGPFQYTHQTEISKDGKPFRVIVDVFPAVHKLGQKIFTDLPVSIVTALRTSQYSVSPEKTVRVVLDLKNSSVYRIEKSGQFLFVYVPDSDSPDYAEWSSAGSREVAPVEVKPTPAAVAVADNEKASPIQGIRPDWKDHDESNTESENSVANKDIQVNENTVETESTIELASATEEPVESAPTPVPVKPNYYQAERPRYLEEAPIIVAAKPVAPVENPPVTVAAIENNAKTEIKNEEPSPVSIAVTTAHKNTGSETAPASVAVQPEVKPMASTPVEKEKVSSVPIPVATDSQVNAEDIYFDEDEVADAISPDDIPAVDESETSAKPTSRFRREPVSPLKMKGTIVAEFPQRMVIEYTSGDFRDPFETLVDDTKQSNSRSENRIPDVETSRLVGILESENGQDRVLLEDLDGYGYILKIGDKVKKGFVDKIDSEKALFQLFEYGWSRTIALYLGRN